VWREELPRLLAQRVDSIFEPRFDRTYQMECRDSGAVIAGNGGCLLDGVIRRIGKIDRTQNAFEIHRDNR